MTKAIDGAVADRTGIAGRLRLVADTTAPRFVPGRVLMISIAPENEVAPVEQADAVNAS